MVDRCGAEEYMVPSEIIRLRIASYHPEGKAASWSKAPLGGPNCAQSIALYNQQHPSFPELTYYQGYFQ